MSSLDERLKQVRAKVWQKSKGEEETQKGDSSFIGFDDDDQQQIPQSKDIAKQDEIEALLKAMKEEVNIEQSHEQNNNDNDNFGMDATVDSGEIENWLKSDDANQSIPIIDHKLVKETNLQAEQFEKQAKEALKELHNDEQMQSYQNQSSSNDPKKKNSSNLLIIEPKERPDLVRSGSSVKSLKGDDDENNKSLEDDLAAAMDDDIGLNLPNQSIKSSNIGDQDKEFRKDHQEPDFLKDRLARLRMEHFSEASTAKGDVENKDDTNLDKKNTKDLQNDDHFSNLFNLPNAPKDQPKSKALFNKSNADENDPNRDMSAFDALDKLDAKKLGPPIAKSFSTLTSLTKPNVNEDDDDIGNPDDWCCICNEDAILACKGCDDDLFCSSCWNEAHVSMDLDERKEHKRKILVSKNDKKRTLVAAA